MRYNFNKVALIIILLVVSLTSLGIIVGIGLHSTTPTARLSRLQAIEDPPLNLTPAPNCLMTGAVIRLTPTPTLTPTVTPTVSLTPTPTKVPCNGLCSNSRECGIFRDIQQRDVQLTCEQAEFENLRCRNPGCTTESTCNCPTTTTPTATPTGPVGKRLSGRFYYGTWRGQQGGGNVGRNAVSQGIPPLGGPEIHIDIPITPLPNGIQTMMDIGNWPNTTDVCSQVTSDGTTCGWVGGADIYGSPKYPHCSTYGGFSLTIPNNAKISYCGNEPYYGFIVRPVDGNWLVSDAYMMDVSTSVTPVPNKPFKQLLDYEAVGDNGIRCDCFKNDVYKAGRGECRLPDNPPQCNTCIKRAYGLDPTWGHASVWANMGGTCGNMYSYTPSNLGKVFIPVSWVEQPNMELWIGVYRVTPTPTR